MGRFLKCMLVFGLPSCVPAQLEDMERLCGEYVSDEAVSLERTGTALVFMLESPTRDSARSDPWHFFELAFEPSLGGQKVVEGRWQWPGPSGTVSTASPPDDALLWFEGEFNDAIEHDITLSAVWASDGPEERLGYIATCVLSQSVWYPSDDG